MAHYEAYMKNLQAWNEAKDQLKTLRAAGESAASSARKNTVGSLTEKIAAIRAAWVPFNEAIAKVEQAIDQYRIKADQEWQAYEKES